MAVLAVFVGVRPVAAAPLRESRVAASTEVSETGSDLDGVEAGNGAIASVDPSGTWNFTPVGQATTSIAVPGGWYKQGSTNVSEAVYVSDTFVRTSVTDRTLTYDVSVTNTSGAARSVTLTGSLTSDSDTTFDYPTLPGGTGTVAAHSTAKVTVGPVAWNLGSASYWWPNVPAGRVTGRSCTPCRCTR